MHQRVLVCILLMYWLHWISDGHFCKIPESPHEHHLMSDKLHSQRDIRAHLVLNFDVFDPVVFCSMYCMCNYNEVMHLPSDYISCVFMVYLTTRDIHSVYREIWKQTQQILHIHIIHCLMWKECLHDFKCVSVCFTGCPEAHACTGSTCKCCRTAAYTFTGCSNSHCKGELTEQCFKSQWTLAL